MITMKKALRQNLRGLDKKEYKILRSLCHLSKNLYNETLYETKQHFSKNGEYLNYYNAWKKLKHSKNYELLPSQVAQQTMKNVDKAFQVFFKLIEKKREGKYNGRINPPNYLDKDGFFILDFPNQMFQIKKGYLRIGVPKQFRKKFNYDKEEIKIPFTYNEVREKDIKRLQILPISNAEYFEYRIVYETETEPIKTKKGTWLAIDLGVSNLATCIDYSGHSFIIDGRKLKSRNRWYNKEKAKLQSIRNKQGEKGTTKKMTKLSKDRNNHIHDYLNKTVHKIIEYCEKHKIEKIIVGDGKGWKQEVNLGKQNNQTFMAIPFDKLKQKLKNKCEYHEIQFKLVDEAYTSKCSALDNEEVGKHKRYKGKRIKRGLFKTSNGTLINADVNGALNIARKEVGKLETLRGVESSGTVAVPQRIRVH